MKLETLNKNIDNLCNLIAVKEVKVGRLQEEIEIHHKSIIKTDEQIRNLKWYRQNCPDCKFGTREELERDLDTLVIKRDGI